MRGALQASVFLNQLDRSPPHGADPVRHGEEKVMRHSKHIVIALALVTLGAFTSPASAGVSCTNELLTGAYGLQISGMLRSTLTGGVAGAGLSDAIVARLSAGAAGSNAA